MSAGLTDYGDDRLRGAVGLDGLPYTTLSYATGPGYDPNRPRTDLSDIDTGTAAGM